MMILDKIINFVTIIYNIPSIFILFFVLIYRVVHEYKTKGNIDELLKDKYLVRDAVEDFRPYGKHINLAFWVFIIYITYF